MSMQITYIDKVALIYIKDKKILMTKSKRKDVWFIPGGKREGSETDEETLRREIKEELGVDLDPVSLKYHGTFEARAHGKTERTFVRIRCYTGLFDGEPTPNAEIEKVAYLPYSEKDRTSLVDHLIFDDLKANNLIQ